MLARNDGRFDREKLTKAGAAEIEPLVRIAADLRNLPSASFKARLKSELGGKKRMSTVAEPVTTVRITASPRLAFRDPAKAIEFYTRSFGRERNIPLRGWREHPARRDHDRRFDHRYSRRMARGRPLQRRNAGVLADFDFYPGPGCGCICGARRGGRDEAGARA